MLSDLTVYISLEILTRPKCWPKSHILPTDLNNNLVTAVIGRPRHVTGWTTLSLVGDRIQDLDRNVNCEMWFVLILHGEIGLFREKSSLKGHQSIFVGGGGGRGWSEYFWNILCKTCKGFSCLALLSIMILLNMSTRSFVLNLTVFFASLGRDYMKKCLPCNVYWNKKLPANFTSKK